MAMRNIWGTFSIGTLLYWFMLNTFRFTKFSTLPVWVEKGEMDIYDTFRQYALIRCEFALVCFDYTSTNQGSARSSLRSSFSKVRGY